MFVALPVRNPRGDAVVLELVKFPPTSSSIKT